MTEKRPCEYIECEKDLPPGSSSDRRYCSKAFAGSAGAERFKKIKLGRKVAPIDKVPFPQMARS